VYTSSFERAKTPDFVLSPQFSSVSSRSPHAHSTTVSRRTAPLPSVRGTVLLVFLHIHDKIHQLNTPRQALCTGVSPPVLAYDVYYLAYL
jgi:hypothetical protein